MANRFTFEVEESGTKRTKAEIISLLDETTAKASQASRSLNQLKADSIKHAEAVSVQASAAKQLGIVRSREIESLKNLQTAEKPYLEGLRNANKTLNDYQQKLAAVTKERTKLTGSTNADANRLLQLKVQEKNYGDVIKTSKDEIDRYKKSLAELSDKKAEHVQNSRVLSSQIVTERAALNKATDAQQEHNRTKQKAQIEYNNLEGKVKSLNRELKNIQKGEADAERETRRMTEASLALANAVGYAAYNAVRNFIELIKDFVVNATIYAARTDEMRLAMLNMSKQSGVSRGELLLQAETMQRMNITTQETYETLTKFQLAQLDVTKATDLARVAQDLAVIAGVETGEEVNRLVHGITTLQIRVLRTAGVFVSLEQSMKEAALAQGRSTESFSEAEKQQILLNKVLEVGARAAGNYETALDNAGKRMRSMVRIFQDLQNAIGGLLQSQFGNLVDILSGLMTLIAGGPRVFAGVVLVLVALASHIFRNMTYTSKWIQYIRMLIAELLRATGAALGLSKATMAQADSAAVATSRWSTFGKALTGIAITAGKLFAAMVAFNVVLEAGAQISKAYGGTTKFNTEELENQKVEIGELLEAQLKLQEIEQQREFLRQKGYTDKYNRPTGFVSRYGETLGAIPGVPSLFEAVGKPLASTLNQQYQDARDTVDKLKAKLEEQGETMAELSAIQREYTDAISKAGKANLDFSGTAGILDVRVDRLKKQFEELSKPVDKDTGLVLTFAEKLNVLKPEILGIDDTLQKVAQSQEDYNLLLAQQEEKFPGFIEYLRVLRGESEKYIEGVGEAAGEAARRLIDVQRRLRSATREIYGLFGQGDAQIIQAGQLELMEKRLQIVRQEIDSINDLRINLNRDVGQPIPQDREARLALQNTYETAVKVRDEIRAAQRANKDFIAEVVKAQQLASDARTTAIKAELIAAKLIAENQTKRIQDEKQLTAEIVALTKQREEAIKDEAGTQRQAYGQFYKEQLENLVTTEDATRRLSAQLAFISGQKVPGLNIPEYGLGGVTTALENIALPAATQAENVATITQSVQNIEKAIGTNEMYGGYRNIAELPSGTVKELAITSKNKDQLYLINEIIGSAKAHNVDPNLALRIAMQETGIRQTDAGGRTILSPKGAIGVMQVMPATAARYGAVGAEPYNAVPNIEIGVSYLADLLKMFKGNVTLATAAYNAGEGAVQKYGGVPPYKETRNYVASVLGQNLIVPTSPKLPAGVEGTAFKQTGKQTLANLTPQEIIALTNKSVEQQRKLQKQIQDTYAGSAQAILDVGALEIETGKTELEQFQKTSAELTFINNRTIQGFYDGEQHKKQIFGETELARKKAAIATHDVILQMNEDEKKGYRESAEYVTKINEEAQIRIREAFNASRDNLAATQADQRTRTEFHEEYLKTIHNNAEASRLKASQNAEDRHNQMVEETNSNWRKSMEFRLQQYQNFEVQRYEETKQTEDNIAELEYRISHATEMDPLVIEEARLRAILEVRQADGLAKADMEANAIRLADAQIYHADRSNAKVLEYFAQQRSVDQVVADAKIGTIERIFGAMDTGIGRLTTKLGFFGDIIKEIISGFARMALSKAFTAVFGLSSGSQQQQQPSIFGGNILSSIFGGGGTGQATIPTTPPFVPTNFGAGITNPQAATQNALNNIFGNVFGTNSNVAIPSPVSRVGGGGTWGEFGKQLGFPVTPQNQGFVTRFGLGASALAFPLVGAGLGYKAGGQSTLGQILGIGGGALAGLVGIAAAPTSIGGLGAGLTGLSALGIGAAVAAPLLIGAAIALSINKKRRQNEKKRDAFTADALAQLNSLLSQVRRDTISGEEALAQAASIRQQYMDSAAALTDKKTRNIALKDVYRLDGIISQIKAASKAQERRRELDEQLVPEFGYGGRVMPVSSGQGGIVPGMDLGYDNVLSLLRPNEVVLNQRQQRAIGGPAVLAAAGVPGFVKTTALAARQYANGGYSSSPFVYESSRHANTKQEINVFVVTDKKYAEDMAVQGRDKIISLTANDLRDRGKIYSSLKRVQ